jgi:hypothetical protein
MWSTTSATRIECARQSYECPPKTNNHLTKAGIESGVPLSFVAHLVGKKPKTC